MACCDNMTLKALRFWLLVQNLALFACAVALLIVSVDVLAAEDLRVAALVDFSVSRGTALLLASAAALVLLVSFLGCCGALLGNRCLLGMFGCFSVLMLVLTLAGFTAALVVSGPAADSIERSLLNSMAQYGNDTEDTAAWDFLQGDFDCCGVRNGSDWATHGTISTKVPSSCCRPDLNGTLLPCQSAPTANNSYYETGCFSSAQQLIGDHTASIAGATAAVVLFLLLSATLAWFYSKMER